MLKLFSNKPVLNPNIVEVNHTYFMETPQKVRHNVLAYTTGEEIKDVAAFIKEVANRCGYSPDKHDCWASSVKKNDLFSYKVEWKSLA